MHISLWQGAKGYLIETSSIAFVYFTVGTSLCKLHCSCIPGPSCCICILNFTKAQCGLNKMATSNDFSVIIVSTKYEARRELGRAKRFSETNEQNDVHNL